MALMQPVPHAGAATVPPSVVPPVVAVVVTRDPGPWFDECLASLVRQDYLDLSILVLDAASDEDPTPRVAQIAPEAFVRRLERDEGFGASANHVLEMVRGASLYLLCHDDVRLDPDAVHLMVEEAYRSNAGIVAPKQVDWFDERRLLHVGMAVDKGGAVVDRVQGGELDHGQHDAVRDVFVAPGGCTLVRADLFAELGGFDPAVSFMGEDLDLCWRAQTAGARVVAVPAARVAHMERLAGGARPTPSVAGAAVSLQELQRRHELYVVLRSYSRSQLVRIVPQMVVLATAEVLVALLSGHRSRALAVVRAWQWNLRRWPVVRQGRRAMAAYRTVPDGEIRRMQVRGSARLTIYLRRAAAYGLHQAHLDPETMVADQATRPGVVPGPASTEPEAVTVPGPHGPAESPPPDSETPRVGRRFGLVSLAKGDVPDLRSPDDGTRPVVTPTGANGRGANQSLWRRTGLWTLVIVVLLYGSRSLLASGFPAVGEILPLPSWASLWHGVFATWNPIGTGTTVTSSAGFAVLGLLATALFGSVGLVQSVVLLGCIPLGAWGVSRLMRASGSTRARLGATLVYLVIPVAYNDLATGRWQALLAYAAVPWVLGILARSARLEPFCPKPVAGSAGSQPGTGRRAWRSSQWGSIVALGLVDALFGSLDPQGLAVTVVVAVGLALGTAVVGGWGSLRAAVRLLAVAVGATVLALVLLAPWSIGVLASSQRWAVLFGVRQAASSGLGVAGLLRLAAGPVGDTPLAYAFVVAAFLPLVIGGRWRLAWATRLWSLALVAWVLAWAGGRDWLGPLALPAATLLAPAGLAVALNAGFGIAALESDLPRYRFGWRQAASVVAAVAVVVGLIPVVGAVETGRWDLPPQGWGQVTAFMSGGEPVGGYRVLWLGDPAALPGPSWPVQPGLAGSLTDGPVPTVAADLAVSDRRAVAPLVVALHRAQQGDTVELGVALAPYAVRYVVVAESLAPTVLGYTSAISAGVPPGLLAALGRQIDLKSVSTESGFEVFANPGWVPERAVAATSAAVAPVGSAPASWRGVLPGGSQASAFNGDVQAGTLRVAQSPSSGWVATGPRGRRLARTSAAGALAATFRVPQTEAVTVAFAGSWVHGLAVAVALLLWLVALCGLAGRRRWLDWWWPSFRQVLSGRRGGSVGDGDSSAGDGVGTARHDNGQAGSRRVPRTSRDGVEASVQT